MLIPIYAGGSRAVGSGEVVGQTPVDPEDYAELDQYRWHLSTKNYVQRSSRPTVTATCPECGWVPRAGVYVPSSLASHRKKRHGVVPPPRFPIVMHREILGLAKGDPRQGDHIDRDPWNNRRSNLRIIAAKGNAQNKGAYVTYRGKPVESAYRNVYKAWKGPKGKRVWYGGWKVQIAGHYLGYFTSEDEAGEFAKAWRLANMPGAVD